MDNIEFKPNYFTSGICDNVAKFKNELIENRLGELIKPYVDVRKFGIKLAAQMLNYRGYEIKCVDNGTTTMYLIRDKGTLKEDFFIVKNNTEISQEDNKYTAINYISEIVRNIKD